MQRFPSTARASLASPAECRPVLGKAAKALFFWYFFNKEKVHIKLKHSIVLIHQACIHINLFTSKLL
jgi:hypothetical protein